MTKKLLPKTLKVYILFAIGVLLIGAPVFYFITQYFYINETNETLLLSKNSFVKYVLPDLKVKDIASFNRSSWNVKIMDPEKGITADEYEARPLMDSLENEEEIYRVLLSPIRIENKSYTLLVRINMIESENLVESIVIVFTFLIAVLLAGLIFITRRLSRKLWMPFYDSLAKIEAFEIDKTNLPRWQSTGIEEFSRLNIALDTLIERNLVIYKSQQEFIENAAHELQTPLAAFKAKLDTLMQLTSITHEQADIIEDLIDAANRLTKLNRNLLLLSKLQKGLLPATESILLKEAVKKHIDFYANQAEAKNIRLTSQIDSEVTLQANSFLLDSMLSNLMLNAISHNHENGAVFVRLEKTKLFICNTGKPKSLDANTLFERFSKTGTSFTGNGLGLAIVGKIADLYHWKISYRWQNNLHCFEVIF
jgi:two-component system sensor histidine kinase ArlS